MRKEQSFQPVVLGQLDIHLQRIKLEASHTPYIKMNSSWIKGLNVRAKTIKPQKDNIGGNVCNFGQDTKSNTRKYKFDLVRIKGICNSKDTTKNAR